MPEGHSIRRLADQWEKYVGQQFLLASPQGRFGTQAALLSAKRLISTDAHGKHLFLEFEGKNFIHIHLGLYGAFRWHHGTSTPAVRGAVRLRAVGDNVTVDLSGPTVCEVLDENGKSAIHARLGVDPLRSEDSIENLLPWLKQSSWPIGKTLLEQSKIAGIGNVYRAEILFLLGLNPHRLSSDLSEDEWREVWAMSRILLEAGVRHKGRIFTTAEELPKPANLPLETKFSGRTYVYKRTGEPCVVCSTAVLQQELASRTLYWCPTCQA